MTRFALGVVLCLAVLGAVPELARAHPMLDQALQAYEEADFDAALYAFDAAARDAELSVEDLLRLFEMRALVHHGMGNESAMLEDLRRLASVRPSYGLGPLAPPPVREAFDAARATNRGAGLRIEERTEHSVPTVVARVAEVPEDLVDHVSLRCIVGPRHDTVSRTSKGTEAKVHLAQPGHHEGCAAEARTWQGGVLFRASVDASRPLPEPVSRAFEVPQYQPQEKDTLEKKKRKKWPWFVAAAGLVLVGGVTAAAVASSGSSNGKKSLEGGVVQW